MNLPAAFEIKMKSLLGEEEYEEYLACFEESRHYGLRVNNGKISTSDFRDISPFSLTPVPWVPNGFYYDGEHLSPAKHPYYAAGLYYLQEPSAMTPASRLPVFPGERILDVCAAPGGKATELAARLGREGLLVANDISSSRAKGLLKNLELAGAGNILVTSEEPGRLSGYFPEYFDKILIDAPCSGEGMFRKEPRMARAWEEHGPEYFSRLQRSIVLQAASMLRPGGMMLYSTCTFSPEENEQIIAYLLKERPDFTVEEITPYEGFRPGRPEWAQPALPELARTVRIFPHCMKGEGHFLALLSRKGEKPEEKHFLSGQKKNPVPEELALFLKDVSWKPDSSRLRIYGERVYYMPEGLPDLRGVRFLRSGLLLGELKKKRFEPSQAFAMFLRKEEYARILDFSAGDARVGRYLKGETLEVDDMVSGEKKGWQLVCVDGYPLGWGKLSGGTLKNKYLPGWRNQPA